MRKSAWRIFAAFLIIALFLSPAGASAAAPRPDAETGKYPWPVVKDTAYTGPLPWEHDLRFWKTVTEQKAFIRMAAYRARIKEPIMSEAYNIALAADTLAGTVVRPGEVFSQNRRLGPYTPERGYREGPTYAGNRLITTCGGGVCKIASLLHTTVVFSDLEVVERHPHSMTVPYVPPGQDATVYYGMRDFRFRNNTGYPIVIWADTVGNELYMAIYGRVIPPRITWYHEIRKTFPAPRQYQYNPALPPGTEKVASHGLDGVLVRSWLTIRSANGRTATKQMGLNFYRPCPEIVERGPQGR